MSIEKGYEGGYRETWVNDGRVNTLAASDAGNALRQKHLIAQGGRLRTLTPVEWERLCGFPDQWTDLMAHNARMSALGDCFHVGTAEWFGRRLLDVHHGLAAHPRIFDAPPEERREFAFAEQLPLFA